MLNSNWTREGSDALFMFAYESRKRERERERERYYGGNKPFCGLGKPNVLLKRNNDNDNNGNGNDNNNTDNDEYHIDN